MTTMVAPDRRRSPQIGTPLAAMSAAGPAPQDAIEAAAARWSAADGLPAVTTPTKPTMPAMFGGLAAARKTA